MWHGGCIKVRLHPPLDDTSRMVELTEQHGGHDPESEVAQKEYSASNGFSISLVG